jgi:hypothetical protein
MAIDLDTALTAFNTAGIDIHANFHTLPSSQVCVIVELARQQGYRKPKNANGSTGRYFFAALQRRYNRES